MIALLLALVSTAHALPWWVDDPAAASELWPASQVEVALGAPAEGEDGLWHDGDALVLRRDGRAERRSAPADDPWTLVALARSWLREVELALPPAPAPVAPAAPPTTLANEPEAQGGAAPWARAALGAGARGQPVATASVVGGVASGALRAGLILVGEAGELDASGPLWRGGGGGLLGVGLPTEPALSFELAGGARALTRSPPAPWGAVALVAEGPGERARPAARAALTVDPGAGPSLLSASLEVGLSLGRGGAP